MHRLWITLGGLLGAAALALSAFASHGLATLVPAEELAAATSRAHTANQTLLLHALALLAIGLHLRQHRCRWLHAAAALMAGGCGLFAGGLWLLRILAGIHSGPTLAIVPIGGATLILAWLTVAVAGWRCR